MIYKMEPLSESDSQRLFYMRIFGRRDGCPPELEQVSKDILKKCGGVPLAVISIASLLASHKQFHTKDQWSTVLNSIGHGLRVGEGDVKDMQTILSYSYYDLPSHLKTCLLYLSIFPEDHEIERTRLIWRWIAEGFVQHKNSSGNLYDIGESYFNELINRSMVEPVGIDFEGRAQSCRVHDIVLDLLCSLSNEQNFVTLWDGTQQSTPPHIKVRRLSLQNCSTSGSATPKTSMLQVRSFTAFNPAVNSIPSLSRFQVLRVLDLEGCLLNKCGSDFKLNHVCNLSHLRYLGLRRTYIDELPVEIGKLHFLQTLDVRRAHAFQELPPTISRLQKLMCLRLDWDTKLSNGLSNLTSLQELTGLRVRQDSADFVTELLGGLTRLRVLSMRWEETDWDEDLVQSLGNLREIQNLDVFVNGGRGYLIQNWVPPPGLRRFLSKGRTSHLSTLPPWVNSSSLPRLTSLDVWLVQVRQDDLHALGTLPSLRSLRLRAAGRIEDRDTERFVVGAMAFPSARACGFLGFATAPSMFPRGAMPMARRLEFSVRAWDTTRGGRLNLDGDLDMGHLPSLEEIIVELCCRRIDGDEEKLVVAALRNAVKGHPNHPTLSINWKMSRHPSGSILPSHQEKE